MPIAVVINGELFAVHSDHLNTPRRMTDATGQPVWQLAYSAFGDEKPTIAKYRFANLDVDPSSGTTNISPVVFNLGYVGMNRDEESGLAENGFRSYRAVDGRYTQPDRIGLGGGWNRYPYANLNPLMFTDANGLMGRGSGVAPQVPGTQYRVRIDPPHVPGQQQHAHIYDKKGNAITAVSQDGSSSHGSCPAQEMPKNKKLLDFLRSKGFALGIVGDAIMLQQLVNNVGQQADPYNPLFRDLFDDGMD